MNNERTIANLASATKHSLDTLGIAYLYVDIAGFKCRQPFVVAKELSSDVLLETTFIDRQVDDISVRRRVAILNDGTVVPIVKRRSPTLRRDPNESSKIFEDQKPPMPVRMAKGRRIPAMSESVIDVVVPETGTYLIEGLHSLYTRRQVSVANGIVSATYNRPFRVKVANFSQIPVHLQKNQAVATAIPAPSIALVMPDSPDGPDFSKGYLENIHTGKMVDRKDLLPAHERRERHRTHVFLQLVRDVSATVPVQLQRRACTTVTLRPFRLCFPFAMWKHSRPHLVLVVI